MDDKHGMTLLYGLETYDMVCRSYVGDEMKSQGLIDETSFYRYNDDKDNIHYNDGEWCRVEDVIELLKLRGVIQ